MIWYIYAAPGLWLLLKGLVAIPGWLLAMGAGLWTLNLTLLYFARREAKRELAEADAEYQRVVRAIERA